METMQVPDVGGTEEDTFFFAPSGTCSLALDPGHRGLACWQVMTVAMMLPSSMPMVSMLVHASRQQQHPRAVQAAFLAGYALVWTAFALITFVGDMQIHWLVRYWFWLDTHSWAIGMATFAVAGVFQFTPLKKRCLEQCRSPLSFCVRYYRKGVGAAWRLGLRHGMICLGSCWALMLVMFGLGVGSLVWMAVLWFVHPTWLLSSVGGV